ncbi:helix-turn-helix domain-containing protein [Agrobacterium vitis]|uniref:Helix-turn-helix domain-containing protein n=1 Tax=Agrobacterium vitis TaxID=373 RepID=A0A6L6VJP6_AGRVI|nr:IclR family transcriptional regulator [Agrobacterium vitis]MUZ76020.1 helix-turn-helix domain-containing protein [Agrobacterium vitis]
MKSEQVASFVSESVAGFSGMRNKEWIQHMSGQLNNSVSIAFSILNLLSESRPFITTQDVTQDLQINQTTAYRFLRTLEELGALVAVKRGQYRLGVMLADLGERAVANNTLANVVQPYLNELADELKESALATTNNHNRTIVISSTRSRQPYSVNINVGTELEAHCTANGKLWLANLSRDELSHYLTNTERTAYTNNTVVEPQSLGDVIALTRANGYATCLGEREQEISAVGVPVLSRNDKMIMGISVFGPNSHFDDAFQRKAVDVLSKMATRIQASLYGDEKTI